MIAYSSQDEITAAVQSAVQHSLSHNLHPECVVVFAPSTIITPLFFSNITEDDIDAELYTSVAGNGPVDILVRTSGVKRLSDFLMWQACTHHQLIPFTPD